MPTNMDDGDMRFYPQTYSTADIKRLVALCKVSLVDLKQKHAHKHLLVKKWCLTSFNPTFVEISQITTVPSNDVMMLLKAAFFNKRVLCCQIAKSL